MELTRKSDNHRVIASCALTLRGPWEETCLN